MNRKRFLRLRFFNRKILKRISKGRYEIMEIICPYCNKCHVIDDIPAKLTWEGGEIECGCGNIITFYNKLNL